MSVSLGVIGFGIMGERMVRAALAHDQAIIRLSGVWDPSPDALPRLAAISSDVPMMASAKDVIAGCDALYIATPPSSHLDYAREAFAAGKAVFLEKPLAEDLAAARRFVALAEAGRERAAVNFPMASSPSVTQLAAWQPQIGELGGLAIQAHFATWPRAWQQGAASWLARRAEGGFTREVLSHFLFLTRRRLGPLVLDSAEVRYPPGDQAETSVLARLHAGGIPVIVSGQVGRTDQDESNEWLLAGQHGAIRLRDWSIAEKQASDGSWHPAADALPNPAMRPLVLRGQLDKLATLTRGGRVDLATLREALEVQEIVEAILAASQTS